MIDRLIEKIIQYKNPVCVGLDTRLSYVPEEFLSQKPSDMKSVSEQILRFNKALIDNLKDIIPCVKVQAACYEIYGYHGMEAFAETLSYAKANGLFTIADVKRNDIGSTAEEYATAYLGETIIDGKKYRAFEADFATVNAYLGIDGINPFLDACRKYEKGIFILVKTSNPSSGELQDVVYAKDKRIYQKMADMTENWGADLIGKNGYSNVGAVVGATYPEQAADIRKKHPNLFMLIPGYGAQGGSAENLIPFFDKRGLGGIVNNSRAVLTAYKNPKYEGKDFAEAARECVLEMQADILDIFCKNGIEYKYNSGN